MEWIHDWYSVVEKHAQTMLQLLEFGMRGMCLGNLDNRSRSLMFQFHRLWKRSQR